MFLVSGSGDTVVLMTTEGQGDGAALPPPLYSSRPEAIIEVRAGE